MMRGVDCPTNEELAAYRAGRVTAVRAAEIVRHMAGCDRCATQPGVERASSPTADTPPLNFGGRRPFAIGGAVGRYHVLGVLGEGGMATVYAAYDSKLDRKVALKVLAGAVSGTRRQRLLREAQAMARLSHPNVVPVFDVGNEDGHVFIAM